MRSLTSTLLCGALSTFAVSGQAAPVQNKSASDTSLLLAQNGKSSYVIALASDAIPAERTAANELQSYLKQVTGANLPIKVEGLVAENTPQILVGAGKRARRLLPKQNWATLGNDSILLKTQGKNIILAGSRPRGTLYAVYQFLEDNTGVRWWTPTESTVPKRSKLNVPPLNIAYTPPFAYREHFTNLVQSDAPYATRMRENGHHQPQDEKWGGHYNFLGWCHTFENLLPLDTYFSKHPEWYSDPDNGNKPCTATSRRPTAWQLNLSNDEARRELTKNALEWIRKNPEAGLISISQNDNMNYCRSEGDMAVIEREGSPSGPLIQFVNQVAADINKEFPDFLVETLAYQYTRSAPRNIKPSANVIIRLCSIEADGTKPLDSDANASFRDDVTAWRKIASHLYIWNYVTNFARVIWPHPNIRVLAPDLRFMAKNKVFGVFEQGDAYSNGVGDFVQMRTWLLSKLMWDPQQDDSKLIDEFLNGYYGAAGPHLRQYIDIIQSASAQNNKPLLFTGGDFSYLNLDVVSRARAAFTAAEKAVANTPELAQRVRRERLVLDNVIITRYEELNGELKKGKAVAAGGELPTDIKAFTEDFIATARANKVGKISEANSFDGYEALLTARNLPRVPLPEPLRSQIPEADIATRVIDFQESAFRYYNQPHHSDLVEDPLASNGKAARESGESEHWMLQSDINTDPERLAAKKWRAYAVIRVEVKAGVTLDDKTLDAPAFTVGIYNEAKATALLSTTKNLRGLEDGKYHLVDLGEVQPENGSYIYVAPPKRDDIANIFTDRLLLVRDE
jgi:hypothetical protein